MSRYADADEAVLAIAGKQLGAVARSQALAAGLSSKALRIRAAQKRLVPMYGGRVWRVPSWPTCSEQAIAMAVLACGVAAFASHSSAAQLHELPVVMQARREVTVPLGRFPSIGDIRLHRSGLLVERDVTTVAGIPTATPERTLVDLSGRLELHHLRRVAHDALRRRITNVARIAWCANRLRSAPGRSAKRMRQLVDELASGGAPRESNLEDFVYESIGRFGMPLPICQHPVTLYGRPCRLDMCYVAERVALEADGFEPHSGRSMFDNDRLRGNEVVLAGYTLLRFTSAFTDWKIAATVARALDRPVPERPERELTFRDWLRVCSDRAL